MVVFVLLLILGTALAVYSETSCYQILGFNVCGKVYPYTSQAEIALVLSFIALILGLVFYFWKPSPPPPPGATR